MRQGSLNVATWVIVNGRLGSGFSSPALICARALADTSVSSSAAFRSLFMYASPHLTNVRDQPSVRHHACFIQVRMGGTGRTGGVETFQARSMSFINEPIEALCPA